MEKTKLEILIVEDNETNIAAAREYFSQRKDISVDFATNYLQALKLLEEKTYSAAMVDVHFPINPE